jgi:acyl-lipid omega-6 desaturase (Delta-12 desaturase)
VASEMDPPHADAPPWRAAVQQYQRADAWRSVGQILTSLVPYLLLWHLMVRGMSGSPWLVIALAPVAAGFLVRIFIILHDCGHGSFFASRRANEIVGSICGVLTFTPFFQWRRDHAMHHATSSDLDRRGFGDVPVLTVSEYLAKSPRERLLYRIYRHPLIMIGFGPFYTFLISHRFVLPTSTGRERRSVYATNAALLGLVALAAATIGLDTYLLVQLPVFCFAGSAAVWMFYCQHQFEGAYWSRHEAWGYEDAAIKGSSYFRLPTVLQWFTGNIGFHHVHHLCPRIPNYFLPQAHRSHSLFQQATTITIRTSLKAFGLKLWDEERQRLVGLDELPAATGRIAT